MSQTIVTLDLEGVLVPEVWIAFAEKTGIEDLKKTTRDIPDYDELMTGRLRILREHQLTLPMIQDVIAELEPLPGALDFLNALRERVQVIILSDTFEAFAKPLMCQLGWPTIFCHRLEVRDGHILNYHLRQPDQKRCSVLALQSLQYQVIAAGDSYNDISMLSTAEHGILFHAPDNVRAEFPQFPAVDSYPALMEQITQHL
ncbi:MAG: bifunctional phosphoserine phosphatase/homoserine phosphotransferase ThrH [Limisphaerales bacterium]